jgi:hypothetical protein
MIAGCRCDRIVIGRSAIMFRSRITLTVALLGASTALAGCGTSMRAVRVAADPAQWQALAGDWRGDYWMGRYDRHGLIAFRLTASPETASGDVLMISDRFGWPYHRFPGPPVLQEYQRTQLLTIRFVRAEDGWITGRMDAYWDPDRRCDAVASFRGTLDGDAIHGTVSSICIGDRIRPLNGRWKVARKRTVAPGS